MTKDTKIEGKAKTRGRASEPFDLRSAVFSDRGFLAGLAAHLAAKKVDPNVVLSIPVWGWTGDGKTCALLTALHFCEAPEYPIGVALINDPTELSELEASVDEYKGMNLAATATATTARLKALSAAFIDECKWPPGTDEATPYVLAIKSPQVRIAYAIFPDLRGGSFREHDEAARAVLSSAHACIVLINPALYDAKSTDAKRYRDEVANVVQRLAGAEVPACILITKSDRYPGPKGPADATHNALSILVETIKRPRIAVGRVSVISDDKPTSEGDSPLPVEQRSPHQLARAWAWAVAQALETPPEKLRSRRPPTQLRDSLNSDEVVSAKILPELRRVGDFSEGPGRVLCSTSDDNRLSFAFISDEAELIQLNIAEKGSGDPATVVLGKIDGFGDVDPEDVQAEFRTGEILLGSRSGTNAIWQFSQASGVRRTPLPFEVAAWALVTPRRLVAVDAAGRLSCLQLEAEKWVQRDYVEGFIPPTSVLRCVSSESRPTILVANGAVINGVALDDDGRFGARISPGLALRYDAGPCEISPVGLAAGLQSTRVLSVSVSAKQTDLGVVPEMLEFPSCFALAPRQRTIAWIQDDLKLLAAAVFADGVVKTNAELAPLVNEKVTGMAWAKDASVLLVSYSDDTWQLFRPYGMRS